MSTDYNFRRAGLPSSHVLKGLGIPSGTSQGPGSAGNEIVHTGSGTDYIVYNAGGDTIVYG